MDLRQPEPCSRSSPFPLAPVPPGHNPDHPDSQNHNSSADTEDDGRRSLSPCDNEPPSPLLRKPSPPEPGRADSRNHSSGADANQYVNSTQWFPSSSQLLRDTALDDAESLDFLVYGDTQDDGTRSLPRYDIEPPPPFPSESNHVSPRQLRTERQSEVGSPLASNTSNESSLFYPINPSSPPSRVSCLITPAFSSYTHCWHFVPHKSRTVKVAKSYSAGMPIEKD
ncbi:hypothetical protein QBC32DRAFT_146460 [Pseudoneurospora amorphoporcata]|uniref:Uncharacterized protein n=1 Tax=Pseudoneurospora amorphoporcata TaxID=241081 RepID=A0AAN6SGE3_9PEZI|nr:hypothetical protein QBC32DRAFT_146460 [Pseudoneurospora amorphoporcata]